MSVDEGEHSHGERAPLDEGSGAAYADPLYARGLSAFGEPLALARCGGWILCRAVPGGSAARDAMGSYPLFACRDWRRLGEDLDDVGRDLVSLVLVVEPFAAVTRSDLRQCFDAVKPFKRHHLVDLSHPPEATASRHHRKMARRALRSVRVEVCREPASFLDAWTRLYDGLVARKHLDGIKAFSRAAFAQHVRVPGTLVLVARLDGIVVGADWYYRAGEVAYAHLAAFTSDGYAVGASYALQWRAIEVLKAAGARWLTLGAGAGLKPSPDDGLEWFEAGWASATAETQIAARVFDRDRYADLVAQAGAQPTNYFPAYRVDELA